MSSRSTQLPLYALAIGFLATGIAGCHGNNQNNANQAQPQNAVATQAADESQDPAAQANLAPAVNTTNESAQQQSAPPPPPDQAANSNYYDYNAPPQDETPEADEEVYAPQPPPPLPEYEQPEAPEPGYLWNPGYWGYAPTGYYWVPGVWVMAPYVGALWTPGYWGFYRGRYCWHRGYWGPHVGFYGGVNYGHGYSGVSYVGGYWDNGEFRYNTAVTRVNTTIVRNTYVNNVTIVNNTRVSYNGGRGGIEARPLPREQVAFREHHIAPLPAQQAHRQQAATNRSQWASQNHGHPQIKVVSQPLNHGRQAPAPMPQQVRTQVEHEHAGQRSAGRTPTPATHPETRPGQPARPQAQNPNHNQQRPAQNHPAVRNETHAPPRAENRPANHPTTRNEVRPQSNRAATHAPAHPQARSTAHPATTRPAQSHTRTRPEARHNTKGHTSNQEQHKQPKHNDNNPRR